jgi:hypothetical protein
MQECEKINQRIIASTYQQLKLMHCALRCAPYRQVVNMYGTFEVREKRARTNQGRRSIRYKIETLDKIPVVDRLCNYNMFPNGLHFRVVFNVQKDIGDFFRFLDR